MTTNFWLDHWEKISVILIKISHFDQNITIFIQENKFENVVYKMVAILSQPHYDICVDENMESDEQVWVLINSLAPGRFGNNF